MVANESDASELMLKDKNSTHKKKKNMQTRKHSPGMELMPQSMTTAPGFIQAPRTISGRPTATTSMSAFLISKLRFFVFEWATVTVASAHLSSSDIGVPTILLRPITTAYEPAIGVPVRLISSMQPFGVQGKKPDMSPVATRPSLIVFRLRRQGKREEHVYVARKPFLKCTSG